MIRPRVPVAKAILRAGPGRVWILATEQGVREIHLADRDSPRRSDLATRGWKLVRRPRWTETARARLERYLAGRGHASTLDFPLDLAGRTGSLAPLWDSRQRKPNADYLSKDLDH